MPDAGMAAYQMGRQRKIILACEKFWPVLGPNGLVNKSDCSGFVTSVAASLNVGLAGTANQIYNAIQSSPWSLLGKGDAAAHLAAVAATNGKFVVGAWKNPTGGNGHVAIIVDTNYASKTVPFRTRAIAYWGQLGGEGDTYSMHANSWGAAKRPAVIYSAIDIEL